MSNFLPSEPKIVLKHKTEGKTDTHTHTHPYIQLLLPEKLPLCSPQVLWESKILLQIKTLLSFLKCLTGFLFSYFRKILFVFDYFKKKINLTEHS